MAGGVLKGGTSGKKKAIYGPSGSFDRDAPVYDLQKFNYSFFGIFEKG